VEAVSTTNNTGAAAGMPADAVAEIEPVAVTAEAADVTAQAPAMATEPGEAASQGSEPGPEAEEPFDDALLDMIALEMAAPQPEDTGDTPYRNGHELHAAELSPAEPIIVAETPRPMAAPAVAVAVAEPPALLTSLQRLPQPTRQPFPGSSLGSSLIANGIIRKPQASPSDPLAPIRRMSQAEKIAFFS
jgi:hypothetical protein